MLEVVKGPEYDTKILKENEYEVEAMLTGSAARLPGFRFWPPYIWELKTQPSTLYLNFPNSNADQ